MRAAFVVVAALAMAGCEAVDGLVHRQPKNEVDINYVADARSGLCFAVLSRRDGGSLVPVGFTVVACDKVPKPQK